MFIITQSTFISPSPIHIKSDADGTDQEWDAWIGVNMDKQDKYVNSTQKDQQSRDLFLSLSTKK